MKDLSRANFIFGWITGIVFGLFGLIFLLEPVVSFGVETWIAGGVLGAAALIRLFLLCLPGSGPSIGSTKAFDISIGVLETLFGALFVLNEMIYFEYFYATMALVLAVLAIFRIMQCVRMKGQGLRGWGSYLVAAILLFVAAVGIVIVTKVWKADILSLLIGSAAFLYGVFLIAGSFLKAGSDLFSDENGIAAEENMEEEFDPEDETRTKRRLK